MTLKSELPKNYYYYYYFSCKYSSGRTSFHTMAWAKEKHPSSMLHRHTPEKVCRCHSAYGTFSTETSWVQSLTHRTILDSSASAQGEKYGRGLTAVKQRYSWNQRTKSVSWKLRKNWNIDWQIIDIIKLLFRPIFLFLINWKLLKMNLNISKLHVQMVHPESELQWTRATSILPSRGSKVPV